MNFSILAEQDLPLWSGIADRSEDGKERTKDAPADRLYKRPLNITAMIQQQWTIMEEMGSLGFVGD